MQVRSEKRTVRSYLEREIVKEVLDRATGHCECNIPSHDHEAGITCNRDLRGKYYLHFRVTRVLSTDHMFVACPRCHRKIVTAGKRTYFSHSSAVANVSHGQRAAA